MSEQEHPKEPWRIARRHSLHEIRDADDNWLAMGDKTDLPTFRRIVACVNACASISTEDLEHATDSGRHRWVIVEVEPGTTLATGTFVVAKDGDQ